MAIANWTCISWVAYAPGTIAVNFTWIEREFNACQMPRSMYPSIFNHFWDIVVYRWRVSGFQQYSWANERFLTTFCFPHRGKCYMDRKRIQWLSNASQHVHTYLQPFTSYSEILVGNRNFSYLPLPLHLMPLYRVAPVTIAVNVTWLERGFNACKTPCCIYPSTFNRFPVIQAWSLKIRHFSTFFCTFWPPLCTPLGQSR